MGFVKLVVWWAERDIVDGRNPTEADRPECKGYENFDTVSNQFWNYKNCIFKFNSVFIKSKIGNYDWFVLKSFFQY